MSFVVTIVRILWPVVKLLLSAGRQLDLHGAQRAVESTVDDRSVHIDLSASEERQRRLWQQQRIARVHMYRELP